MRVCTIERVPLRISGVSQSEKISHGLNLLFLIEKRRGGRCACVRMHAVRRVARGLVLAIRHPRDEWTADNDRLDRGDVARCWGTCLLGRRDGDGTVELLRGSEFRRRHNWRDVHRCAAHRRLRWARALSIGQLVEPGHLERAGRSASDAYIDYIGRTRTSHPDFGPPPYGVPYVAVGGSEARRPVTFTDYGSESDTGFQGEAGYPIPDVAKTQPNFIEGGAPGGGSSGDRHMLIVDRDKWVLFELFGTRWNAGSQRWEAGSGAVYVWPASHRAGSNAGALPMGARLRLKSSKSLSGYPAYIQNIFRAMQTHGLIVADNGSDMYVTGAMDSRWNNGELNPAFGSLTAGDFDVIRLGWR